MTISTLTYNWGSTYQFDAPSFSIDRTKKPIFFIHGFQSNPNQAFGDPH